MGAHRLKVMPDIASTLKAYAVAHPKIEGAARSIVDTWRSTNLARTRSRKKFAMSYFKDKLSRVDEWAPKWTEGDNFYYDLTSHNRSDLASLVAVLCGEQVEVIDGYISELSQDTALRSHIRSALVSDPLLRDIEVGFGRREGWYAFVRALKPKVVVETGVHHGVGACVITAALLRNKEEGHPGQYFGTDIDPNAGRLLSGPYAEFGRVLYGDSIVSLSSIKESIDIFINDSDHSAEYEGREYEAVESKLSERSLVLGDNSHVTSKLTSWARSKQRPFVFFREEPLDHWYPGAGIGISPAFLPILPNS